VNSLLQPLTVGFRLGVMLRRAAYRRGWLEVRRLARPVISVGNLSVGGTGKTPLVAFIARTLVKLGAKPGILTRGYGRRGRGLIALPPKPERLVDPREVGDEPALLARALPEVPIVICADRYRGGRLAEERLNVNVHILDDGFQHLALARDLDLVVLDVTQELDHAALLPAGRLREPLNGLQRAHVVVISRMELGDPQPLACRVAEINPHAKIFRSATKLCGLKEISSGETGSRENWRSKRVLAFCGIGNPQTFFQDLRKWEFSLASEEVFPDHHAYMETELSRLSKKARQKGAAALLTTEKDGMNFPTGWKADLPILACAIQAEVVEAQDFEAMLQALLETAGGRVSPGPECRSAKPGHAPARGRYP